MEKRENKKVLNSGSGIVDNLLNSLLEEWNDRNLNSKLDKDLIDLIKLYQGYSYTIGVEDTFARIKKEIDKYIVVRNKVSYQLVKDILNPKNYKL